MVLRMFLMFAAIVGGMSFGNYILAPFFRWVGDMMRERLYGKRVVYVYLVQ